MKLDPVIQNHRAQIADLDQKILEALNQRILLVKQVKDYKEAQGLGFHDPAQEDRVIDTLCAANQGPLSEDGLRRIFALVLAWAKRDAARAE